MLTAIEKRIRDAFSSAAMQYDALTSLHKEIGKELVKKVVNVDQCDKILDVGMGTGKVTKRLTFYFPDSLVCGMDFSSGMIEKARQEYEPYKIVQAHAAHLPFKENSFDVVVSNLAYQWVKPLDHAFKHVDELLNKGGVFYFTLFTDATLCELFESIEAAAKEQDKKISLNKLPTKDEVEQALQKADFKDYDFDYERIKVHFPDMMDLIKWVKDIGANALGYEGYLGKDLLERASEIYAERFSGRFGIDATFEVTWVEVKK